MTTYTPPGRYPTVTEKIRVPGLDPVYAHFEHGHDGRLTAVSISSPGRYHDHQIGALLDAIAARVTAALGG